MVKRQKRIAAIHDISCAGRCSITVALPILSCAGIETNIIPTAVLSTHTGEFNNYTYHDLTEEIIPVAKHWQSLNRNFDAIYTGYLGSFEQINIIKEIFKMFESDKCIKFVDPVMADHGKLYANFDFSFVEGMRELCKEADLVVPNVTEAVFLTGSNYMPGPYEKGYIEDILIKMSRLCKNVIITGIDFEKKGYGAVSYDGSKINYTLREKVQGRYYGTGDVFASALLASMLSDIPIEKSLEIAVDFTLESIKRTKAAETDVRFGVNFEQGLFEFIKQLKKFN